MADDLRGPWTVDEDDRPGMEWNRDILDVDGNTVCFMAHSNGRAPDKDAAKARAVAALPDLLSENKRLRLKIIDIGEALDGGNAFLATAMVSDLVAEISVNCQEKSE